MLNSKSAHLRQIIANITNWWGKQNTKSKMVEHAPHRVIAWDPPFHADAAASLVKRVYGVMRDGRWRTLDGIRLLTGGSSASVSARLRDLRKADYGCHVVERRQVAPNIWEYRVAQRAGAAHCRRRATSKIAAEQVRNV